MPKTDPFKNLKAKRPRDQWGQFRSRADIAAEHRDARIDSLRLAQEQLYWDQQED